VTKFFLTAAGVFGASGVLLGAFGAHALRDLLDEGGGGTWETAVIYQLVHAVALTGVGLWSGMKPSKIIQIAGVCLIGGVLLFSGSLYVLVLHGPSWLGPVTPLGGVLLTAAWICIGLAARRHA
jgi:uncharacterized membrane protein YgdD (TMEM256/DUF423 family)|tara:strand:- start:211 stop:582 length:372 start_codon:yes stop_codon:yes gene_type:complete